MALGLLASAMYISCIFHVVCASFSALATRKLADAEANSSGIWALLLRMALSGVRSLQRLRHKKQCIDGATGPNYKWKNSK